MIKLPEKTWEEGDYFPYCDADKSSILHWIIESIELIAEHLNAETESRRPVKWDAEVNGWVLDNK